MAQDERCPKCGGEAFLSQEDFAGVVESTDPVKVAIKQTFKCKSCGEVFSKITFENLDKKKQSNSAKKMNDLFEGFHKPGFGLDDEEPPEGEGKVELF
jgi:uncharacterized protein with PIN domain